VLFRSPTFPADDPAASDERADGLAKTRLVSDQHKSFGPGMIAQDFSQLIPVETYAEAAFMQELVFCIERCGHNVSGLPCAGKRAREDGIQLQVKPGEYGCASRHPFLAIFG
jgi:hypothetical protein